MNVVLKPPVPRILPAKQTSIGKVKAITRDKPATEAPLMALLSRVPVSSFQYTHDEVGAIKIPSSLSVGAAIEALVSKRASLAAVLDSDSVGVQAEISQVLSSDGRYLGLVQLSWLVLWSLQQADVEEQEEWTEPQPEFHALTLPEHPADSASAARIDLPALVSRRWTGEGDERRRHQQSAETLSDASSGDILEGGTQDFMKAMSRFAFFRSVKVASLARTPYWQPFLPLSSTSSLMDAVSLISQHGPSVIPVLRFKPSEQIPGSHIAASSPPLIIQGYLTQHAVLSALNKLSGLSWFDSLVGDRTLNQLAYSGLGTDALLHRIDVNTPLLTALLTLCQAEQAALPVFEVRTAGKLTIIGEISEQDAQVLLTDPGAFRRRREVTVGEYLRMRGAGVQTDEMVEESFSKEATRLTTLEMSDGSDAIKDNEEKGALVCTSRATVSRVLAAMSIGGYGRVYVDEVSAGGPRGCNSEARGNSDGTPFQDQNLRFRSSQVDEGLATIQAGNPIEDASKDLAVRHLIVSGKDIISLLTHTSSWKPGLNWESFFENVVKISGETKGSCRPLLGKLPLQTARPSGPSS